MKKRIYLLVAAACCMLMCAPCTQAQQKFWGINQGSVFHINDDGSEYQEAFSSVGDDVLGLKLGPDGVLYGLLGGNENGSTRYVVYTYNPSDGGIKIIHYLPNHFYPTDFIVESSGVFYVSGYDPDTYLSGILKTILIIKAANLVNHIIYSGVSDSPNHDISFIDGGDGRFYFNITSSDGGRIESIKKDGTDVFVTHNFADPTRKPIDGASPETKLTILTDGSLLGATSEGGAFGNGTLYKMDKDGSNFNVVYNFKSNEKIFNHFGESVITASNGKVFGLFTDATFNNNVNGFSLDSDGTNFQNVYPPPGSPDRHSNLVEFDEYVYGLDLYTKYRLDEYGWGPAFDVAQILLEYNPNWSSGTAGISLPEYLDLSGPIAISNGVIYGTFYRLDGTTIILSLSPILPDIFDSKIKIEYQFEENSIDSVGYNTIDIIKGKDGIIYGLTSKGGTGGDGVGTIFKLNSNGVSNVRGLEYPEWLGAKIVDGEDGYLYGVGTKVAGDGSKIYRVKKDGTDYQPKIISANYLKTINLIRTQDGDILGTTEGRSNAPSVGYMFTFKPNISGIETKLNFSLEKGKVPLGNIIQLDDGFIYGTTEQGGTKGGGVVYKVLPSGQGYTKLHEFDYHNDTDGEKSNGGVADGGDGFLYGVTPAGGIDDQGVIYKIRPDGSDFSVIHKFNGSVVSKPFGEVVIGDDEFLYGSAKKGSVTGALFKIKKDGTGLTKIFESYIEGNSPRLYFTDVGLEQSNVYVVSPVDGATSTPVDVTIQVKEVVNAVSYTLELSKDQDFVNIDQSLSSANSSFIVTDLDQNTTYYTRAKTSAWSGYGPTTSFTTVGTPGAVRLWGITTKGGTMACSNDSGGTIFSINPDGTSFIKHFDYDCATDEIRIEGECHENGYCEDDYWEVSGKRLDRSLIQGEDGMFYGVSIANPIQIYNTGYLDLVGYWGFGNEGEIFRIDNSGNNFTTLYSDLNIHYFSYFTFASNGDLYVTNPRTSTSPSAQDAIRRFKTDGSTDPLQASIFTFRYGIDGSVPRGMPIELPDGYLYGVTMNGGEFNRGIIYKVKLDGTGFTRLHSFEGGIPRGGLLDGKDGFLYGMDYRSYGTIYKIKTDGTGYSTLHHFGAPNSSNGRQPYSTLIEANDVLYGMTPNGGRHGNGIVFSIQKDGTGFNVIHHFEGPDGETPLGDLTFDGVNTLYGMTSAGGNNNLGTIFSMSLDGSVFTKLFDFSTESGGSPNGKLLMTGPMPLNKLASSQSREVQPEVSETKRKGVIVYPNPSNHTFTLEMHEESQGYSRAVLLDLSGKEVSTFDLNAEQPVVFGESLPSGVYILRTMINNKVGVHRLIKQ